MKTSDTFSEIVVALALFRDKVSKVKNTTGVVVDDHFYAYAPLPEVLRVIKPALKACALVVIQDTRAERGLSGAMTRIAHTESSEWIETEWLMFPAPDLVSAKASVTSARRYSLLGVLGIAPIDDDAVMATGRGILADELAAKQATPPTPPNPSEPVAPTTGSTPRPFKMPAWKVKKIEALARSTKQTKAGMAALLKTYGGAAEIDAMTRDDSDRLITHLENLKEKKS